MDNKQHVLYLGPEDTLDLVKEEIPDPWQVTLSQSPEHTDQNIQSADVLFDAYMKVPFPKKRLKRAEQLSLVITATTGADHIDQEFLKKKGIPLKTLRGQNELLNSLTPAAEHSWTLLTACARMLPAAVEEVKKGIWNRNHFPGVMLKEKTLGIIGCGRIGQWMGTYARAFDMKVQGFDPHLTDWPSHIKKKSMEQVLRTSDFLTIHVPLTEETTGLLGKEEFQQMKEGIILINTSRGKVIEEHFLLESLKDGTVKASGLDVLTGEPDIDEHPLVEYARNHDNLIITPHIGGFSPDALQKVLTFSTRRIVNYFSDRDETEH